MTQKNAKNDNKKTAEGFSEAEKKAMKERSEEIKREKSFKSKTDGEQAVLVKINEMEAGDKKVATSLHELIKQNFPQLSFRTWYGFPAYTKDGKVITFFRLQNALMSVIPRWDLARKRSWMKARSGQPLLL